MVFCIILLAALFLNEERFLLIDEPTNHLDSDARAIVSAYLRRKKGYILVSHDRRFLDGCVDHILALNHTGPELVRGTFSSWFRDKEDRDRGELARNEKLKGEIRRLEQAARQTSAWSDRVEKTKYASKNSGLRPDRGFIGHKSAKLMRRAKSLEDRQQRAIQEKSALLQDLERADSLKLAPLMYHSERMLEARTLTAAYRFYCDKDLEGAHSANADTRATYEVLMAQLDRYEDLPNDIEKLAEFSSQNKNVDLMGRLVYDDQHREVINFGKYKGQLASEVLKKDPGYFGWIQQGDFPSDTKRIMTAIKLRLR